MDMEDLPYSGVKTSKGRTKKGLGGAQSLLASLVENYAKMIAKFIFFTKISKVWGHVIHCCKIMFKTFPTVYYTPPKN